MKYALIFLLIVLQHSAFAGAFGPKESRIIFEEGKSSSYNIENSDSKLAWLVQAWIEDASEKRTDKFHAVPVTFRVEPLSDFSVRILKTGALPEDRESLFWIISNSLPGGERTQTEKKDSKVNAKISLAYRFKVPMIYRPKSLVNIKQQPELLRWYVNAGDKLKVYNPTKHIIQLHNININGSLFQGKDISYIVQPETEITFNVSTKVGNKIQYGVINDYGAVKNYKGVVEK
ncbi:molecular chaperone [Escherichia albertii]